MNRITSIVAGLSLAFVGTSATIAGTINVPADAPTIAAAINAAVTGDVINIAAGTYNEHSLNPGGKAITIQGTLNANGSLATIINAQTSGGVFTIINGEGVDTVIKDLIITGGIGTELLNIPIRLGGGIYCNSSNPTISGCTIAYNSARGGGGICCLESSPTISSCTIEMNSAEYAGGGINCDFSSNPSIIGCTIETNAAKYNGGGISCDFESSPIISGCTIMDNTSGSGGGIYCGTIDDFTIVDCTILSNEPENITLMSGVNLIMLTSPTTPGDVDGDGDVDTNDLSSLRGTLSLCESDTDMDGDTDIEDLLNVVAGWGTTCP